MDNNELLHALSNMMDEKLAPINERLDTMDSRLDTMDSRLDTMDSRLDTMDSRLDTMENDIKGIKVSLENETNRNIRIVAEGHLDLSRKLNEALHITGDIKAKQEIQDIYLSRHEDKLKRII